MFSIVLSMRQDFTQEKQCYANLNDLKMFTRNFTRSSCTCLTYPVSTPCENLSSLRAQTLILSGAKENVL